ncbi:MaoC/PaaZ C-terminal domain-containing protein [Stigmatella sp. ncwal1]|uniref:MaoC/PaaZ C-terminal domain-containing protein n=1 Tax=Stigmatella ashevillensis TaxID=2995309 RepID=A0ABT5D806_9BACT|nr:MaoC/PaaZ C-terminal domain-containing protein [Stigmatella ashevillena]MDC0708407.1 MaoC/PaaZ C-terminal domain-containing protein [Stigmatella ashevillena]
MARDIQAGDTFTHVRECDRYRPIYYAGASGDYNPIHTDPEAGKAAGLGGVILQGLCTLGWAVEAVAVFVGDPGKIRRVKVRFSRPVVPEDTLTFEGRVTAVADGRLTAEVSATNQRGEAVLKGAVIEAVL